MHTNMHAAWASRWHLYTANPDGKQHSHNSHAHTDKINTTDDGNCYNIIRYFTESNIPDNDRTIVR